MTTLRCRSGCPPLALPTAEPLAGWELAQTTRLGPVEVDHWQMGGMADGSALWDRFAAGRLATCWGAPGLDHGSYSEPDGREAVSEAGARFAQDHADDTRRIGEMSDALAAFGEAVQADPALEKRHRAAGPLEHCLAAYMVDRARVEQVLAGEVSEAPRHPLCGAALTAFWADDGCRGLMMRVVGAALVIELHCAIVRRGGSYADIVELTRQLADFRTERFGGYRGTVAFLNGDHATTVLGEGSPLASLGGAEPLHRLPRGVQLTDTRGRGMAISPSHGSNVRARNVDTLDTAIDVEQMLRSARVGGTWSSVPCPPPRHPPPGHVPERRMACSGGRPLTLAEVLLVRLCDFGTKVGKGKDTDWRKLTVTEAVDEVRAAATRGREETAWGSARHMTTKDGKALLRGARVALREAMEALGLIPVRPPAPHRAKREEPVLPEPLTARRGSEVATWRA